MHSLTKVLNKTLFTIAFLNHNSIWIRSTANFGILVSETKNIFQAVECHLYNFTVHHCEEVTQWRYTTLIYQKPAISKVQ